MGKQENVFVQILNFICLNCKMYGPCVGHMKTATQRKHWCHPIQYTAISWIVTTVPQIWRPAYFYCPWESISLAPTLFSESRTCWKFLVGGTWLVWNGGLFHLVAFFTSDGAAVALVRNCQLSKPLVWPGFLHFWSILFKMACWDMEYVTESYTALSLLTRIRTSFHG